jgi:hypothetical protein
MKITIESYGRTHSTEFDSDDVTMSEYIDTFYALLIGVTFHENTIIEGFRDFLEEKDFYKKEEI